MRALLVVLGAAAVSMGGCASTTVRNPSFPLTLDEAQEELRQMAHDPAPLSRPVVVAGGYMDPGIAAHRVAERLRQLTSEPERVLEVAFFSNATFDSSRERLIEEVEAAFPSGRTGWTVEVDVVGISMGGLVARYAAENGRNGGKRLRIRRLFTISTPHLGADMAGLPTLDSRQVDMRAGSAFVRMLADGLRDEEYEIIPYVRLGDTMVGAENAAPEGMTPWWVPNKPLSFAHLQAHHDPRITADIARRLRGERPHTMTPAQPLP